MQKLKQAIIDAMHSRQFATAVEGIEQLIGAIAQGGAAALPAPVAPLAQTAAADATKLAVDTTDAAITGSQAPGTVAALDAKQLAADIADSVNDAIGKALPGVFGQMAENIAKGVEASVLARLAPAAAK